MIETKIDGRVTHPDSSETFFSESKKKEWNQATKYIKKHLPRTEEPKGYEIVPVRIGHGIQYQYANGHYQSPYCFKPRSFSSAESSRIKIYMQIKALLTALDGVSNV